MEQQRQGLSVYTPHLVDGIWNGTADCPGPFLSSLYSARLHFTLV